MDKKDLMKENYDISKYVVMNTSKHKVWKGESYCLREYQVYDIEDIISDSDKLEIIDSLYDGIGTYTINLINKYVHDKEEGIIKKASWGSLNKNSLNAWIKKNDSRRIMHKAITKGYGEYHLFGNSHRMSLTTPTTDFSYKRLYDEENIVKQWFHDMLVELDKNETKHFHENDSTEVLKTEIRCLLDKFISVRWVNLNLDNLDVEALAKIKYMLDNCCEIVDATLEVVSKEFAGKEEVE